MRFAYSIRIGPQDVGTRVTIRVRTPDGLFSDTIGILEELDETHLTVRNKRGDVIHIARADIVAAKAIANDGTSRGVWEDSRSKRAKRASVSPPKEKG